MVWKITSQLKSVDGVPIGTAYGGGYVGGFISHTSNGVPTHALIIAPKATGAATGLQWKTTNTSTANATSTFDGVVNTAAMVAAGIANHPAAQFCVNLNIAGFTDWYLPSRFELDIAYFNCKPVNVPNRTNVGLNDYSVPRRLSNYTPDVPAQTQISPFNAAGESFTAAYYWGSNELNSTQAVYIAFGNENPSGGIGSIDRTVTFISVRAFRRIAL